MLLMLLALLGYFFATPPADRHPGNPDAPIASARPLKAIEDVALGDWVLAHDPGLSPAERASASASSIALADPKSLRVISAEMPEGEGEVLHVELLRTEAWLQENRDQNALWLQFDELGIKGWATILSVHAAPSFAPSPETDAHLVTGRFVHETAVSYDLAIVDHTGTQVETIGTTGNHPFWSEDRQDYVQAGQLQPGERLRQWPNPLRPLPYSPQYY